MPLLLLKFVLDVMIGCERLTLIIPSSLWLTTIRGADSTRVSLSLLVGEIAALSIKSTVEFESSGIVPPLGAAAEFPLPLIENPPAVPSRRSSIELVDPSYVMLKLLSPLVCFSLNET